MEPVPRRPRARVATWAAAVAIVATVAIGASLAPGFDQRQVIPDDPSVWAMQSVAGQRFGRVNTVVGEVDTVKEASSPTDLVQYGSSLLVYSDNLGTVTTVDTAKPANIDTTGSQASVATPSGTDTMVHAGDFVSYLTDSGQVMAGRVSNGSAVAPSQLDPFASVTVPKGQERPEFRAIAIAISSTGEVAAYSAERGSVLRASAATGLIEGMDTVAGGPTGDGVQMTWVGSTWVLYDPSSGSVWKHGSSTPFPSGADASGRLQQSSDGGNEVTIADNFGAITIALSDGSATRAYGTEGTVIGEPAAPAQLPGSGDIVGAWLPAGAGPGVMWESNGVTTPLDYGGQPLGDQRTPQLRSNGSHLILNESRSGWVWDAPSGALVASSQQWDPNQDTPANEHDQDVATQVTDPRSPVAEDDQFGVRAGRQVILPVLLNDHDANKDVLTVWQPDLGSLDPAFGKLSLADDDQSLVVTVSPNATGTATFSYVITDGTTSGGLLSEPATVTLTVKPLSINSAPEWCGVSGCLTEWPQPQVNPGGTVSTEVLSGWVDPEGDPIYLADATTTYPAGVVAASPEGRVVFQQTDSNAGGGGTAPVNVIVSDSWGATATKTLNVTVLPEPELRITDLSLTVTAGVTATVDVGGHVTGAVGPLQLTEASLAPGDDAVVAVAQSVTGFTFTAQDAGSHLVDFKVTDGTTEARGVARITVVAPADERLTTVPLTAFVRSKEDATVDVLKAVSNPGGRVLLISDVAVTPVNGSQLTSDVIGFSALRVSGDTANAQPGTLGVVTYTVSDGSGRPEMTATGEVTVVLLGTTTPTPPLAVDDAITMRVGTQADVSVLANDIVTAGNVIALDPASVTNEQDAGLVFAAGSKLRYLAPSTAGVYVIDYSAFVLGYPAQRDTARLIVTVLDNPTNAAPTPRNLTGRVASGESVRLAFDGTGLDPDGDKVSLKRVESQPASGIAAVAADGLGIVYTSEPGFSGQVSFTYSVIDARGQTAIGTATVGVIAADLEARPVTYTDYVQAQAGAGRTVVVVPTANDFDLAGGELSLVDVSPDAPLESDEYRQLADRVVSVVDGTVTLSVGDQVGTYVYLYTVRNDAGSTAVSRIILKAVREPVADVPIVTDTVLSLDTRESLPTGVDVLTDKVSWASGDPAGLKLSLWGSQPGLEAHGWTISGPVSDLGQIVPFQVTGLNFAGEQVTSYGFLRIPGLDESRLSLKETYIQPEVVEGQSVTFDLKPLVAVPADAQLVIDPTDVEASGVRKGSTCELVSGTLVKYTASEGAPYSDLCRISARVSDQDRFTLVPVPITIIPKAPAPILTSASLEISPGATTTFDLAGMVTWPKGATPRSVDIALQYLGQQFEVTRVGTNLTVTAKDRSVPGNVDGATVSLTSDPDVAAVSLSFTVGPAPSLLPKGASINRQCSQAAGTSCVITVIGGAGEVNPLPNTPLEVTSVTPDANCPGVSFIVKSARTVMASWTVDTPGSTCTATFTVKDALARVSAGDRVGTITLDLQGYPASPAEVRQVAFGDGTLTLAVTGGTGVSYPPITGYAIYEGATKVATCGADGVCPQLTGLSNGVKHTYSAKAVNNVGESRGSVSVVAWAYAPPGAPANVTWTPTRATGGGGQRIDIELDVVDANTSALQITSPTGETKVVSVSGKGHVSIPGYFVGSNDARPVTITPLTSLDLPAIPGAQAQGAAVTFSANGVGAPAITDVASEVLAGGTSAKLTVTVTSGGAGSETWVGWVLGTTCQGLVQASGGTAVLTVGVTANITNSVTVCAQSRVGTLVYDNAATVGVTLYPWVDPGAPSVTTGYRVATTCEGAGMWCSTDVTAPVIDLTGMPPGAALFYRFGSANPTADFSTMPIGSSGAVTAFVCVVFDARTTQCSLIPVTVPPDPGHAVYRTKVTVQECTVGEAPQVTVAGSTDDWSANWTLRDENNAATTDYGAMRTARVTISFTGALAGIDDWTSATSTCSGAPDPTPTPTPGPSTTPSPSPTP